jgi:hypothetical protein
VRRRGQRAEGGVDLRVAVLRGGGGTLDRAVPAHTKVGAARPAEDDSAPQRTGILQFQPLTTLRISRRLQ